MNIFTLTIPSQSSAKNLNYTAKIRKYNGTWTNVFYGKVFVQAGQTRVDIELSDILWSYKFDGKDYFYPALNTTGDDYVMCTTTDSLQNWWHNQVKVEIPSLSVETTKWVDFFNYRVIGERKDPVINQQIPLFMDYQPVAHIPSVVPTGFEYRQLVWNGTFQRQIDGTTTVIQRSNLGTIVFSGGEEWYGINQTVIAKIDACPKPYYLAWLTDTGAMQVQGFLKSSEFSLNYSTNKRIDMSSFQWNYNNSVTAKWKLKSDNLSDKDYKAYGQIFRSPYLILIDTTTNRLHFVNVKSTDYTEKKNGVSNNRKIFFEIDLEAAEKMIL